MHSAADALRQILEKLPIDNLQPATDDAGADYNANTLDHGPAPISDAHTPFQPYAIPRDPLHPNSVPPPAFRPLPPSAQSTTGSGAPINSITHTQIITTAYGAPATTGDAHGKQPATTLLDIETDHWQNVPIGPGVSQPGADGLYHVVSLKNHGINVPDQSLSAPIHHHQTDQQQLHNNGQEHPAVVVSQEVVHEEHQEQHQQQQLHHYQHEQQHEQHQQQVHVNNFNIQQQLLPHYGPPLATAQQLPHVFGPNAVGPIGYEIQKSIGYELRGPHFVQQTNGGPVQQYGQRRVIKSTKKRPTGARPMPYQQQRRRRHWALRTRTNDARQTQSTRLAAVNHIKTKTNITAHQIDDRDDALFRHYAPFTITVDDFVMDGVRTQ